MKAPFRVAVIGGGVSGLAAATELALAPSDRKIEVTLFEERAIFGGRTRSLTERTTGDIIDNGQHLMMGCYTSTMRYLRNIGTLLKVDRISPLDIPYFKAGHGNVGSLTVSTTIPSPTNLLVGLLRSELLASFEKSAAIRFGLGIMLFRFDKAFAHRTCRQLFAAAKQPDSVIAKLWEPVVLATMNASIDEASAQVFLNTIRTVFLMDRRFPALVVPRCGLSELLVDPGVELLRSQGHHLRLGTGILEADERSGVVYVKTVGRDDYEVFDAVIVAASPFPEWVPVAGKRPTLRFSPIVNAFLWTDTPILDHPINGFVETTLQWAFPKKSNRTRQLIACTVSAAKTLVDEPSERIVATLTGDLRSALPHTLFGSIEHSVVIKEKRATYLLDPDTEANRPPMRSTSAHIYIASDLAHNGLPMTIEGAVRNGQRAAIKLVHDHLFIRIPETHP
ncbi:MAG: FAD-dependent oxidoreductase [Bacteroidetes bacterium]|nr:FAD-dependent oxidoreductase [Bacteroidota bacterium]